MDFFFGQRWLNGASRQLSRLSRAFRSLFGNRAKDGFWDPFFLFALFLWVLWHNFFCICFRNTECNFGECDFRLD